MRAILLLAMTLPCVALAEERSATWFADHPKERFAINTICKDHPGSAHQNPNCENAFQGGVISDRRDGQRRIAQSGIANLGQPPATYWSNPANRQSRDYWAFQCRRAEAQHVTQERLEAMYCPAIKAAGGY
jgi:hypothetical protein